MLEKVASALGELVNDVVFVGGCTTSLLITDEYTKEQVRYTDDVDLIVDVMGYPEWNKLQEQLKQHGFSIDMGEEVLCRMLLGDLKVDFMPTDEKTLGFTNRWYKAAVDTANNYPLTDSLTIKLIAPEYFIATKLEAFHGRGKGDALASHDIEDILNIFDGREEITHEIAQSSQELKEYLSTEISKLLEDPNFEYAIQSLTNGDSDREGLIFNRLDKVIHGQL
jgi:predicted nucleotidyltransferase